MFSNKSNSLKIEQTLSLWKNKVNCRCLATDVRKWVLFRESVIISTMPAIPALYQPILIVALPYDVDWPNSLKSLKLVAANNNNLKVEHRWVSTKTKYPVVNNLLYITVPRDSQRQLWLLFVEPRVLKGTFQWKFLKFSLFFCHTYCTHELSLSSSAAAK